MDKLLCGLGFHKWQHNGYDVWKEKMWEERSFEIHYAAHRRCVNCEKRIVALQRKGVPPEVQVNDDLTSFVDHSSPYMDPKQLLEKE